MVRRAFSFHSRLLIFLLQFHLFYLLHFNFLRLLILQVLWRMFHSLLLMLLQGVQERLHTFESFCSQSKEPEEWGLHHKTAKLSNFCVRYQFYMTHVTMHMGLFQGTWIPHAHFASNQGSSGWSAVKLRKVGEDTPRAAASCGENYTLTALFILSTKLFKICAPFLGYSVFLIFLPFPSSRITPYRYLGSRRKMSL